MVIPLTRVDLYQCSYCQLWLTKKIELDQHTVIEHPEENNKQNNTLNKQDLKTNRSHECVMCNKTYAYQQWREHMRTVHGNVNLICDLCGKSFKCQKYLHRHRQNTHLDKQQLKEVRKFTCIQCPKVFNYGDCLNKHVRNCHGQKVRCQICNSVLKSEVYLSSHMQRVHCDSSKMSKCQICGKQFKSKRQVKIHIGNVHEKKLCPKCGKMYSTLSFYYHVKNCKFNVVTQNDDIIGRDDMHANLVDDRNGHVYVDNGQINADSNDQDDVNGSVQLCIKNKGHFKIRTFKTARDIYKNNQIYLDDTGEVDVDDSGLRNKDLSETTDKIREDNVSCYQDTYETKGVTITENIDMKGGSVGVISDHVNGDSNDQINKGDIIGHFCKICNKKLKSEDRVKIHIKNAHNKCLPVKCPHCGKFYFNLKYFEAHVKICSCKKVETPSHINKTNFENEYEIKIERVFQVDDWAFSRL